MTLEEEIDELMDYSRSIAEIAESDEDEANRMSAEYFADYYKQLAEWLKELSERRKLPEIIRCYECVHASDIVPILNPNLRHCDKCGFFKSKDYFCGDAERRTDDKTNKGSSC